MTKDGIGWGAYAGVVAVQLADSGFTGSGTVFDEPGVESTGSLGETFHVPEGYLKPYPCCRWAQPGVEAVLSLTADYDIDPSDVESVTVHTFEEATYLQTRVPESPEEAQYSYPYPVAAALARGRFTQAEHASEVRTDPGVSTLAESVELRVDEALDARFPSECLARVELETDNGTRVSDVIRPSGARSDSLSTEARREKARRLVAPTLPTSTVETVEHRLEDGSASVVTLLEPWRT